MAIFDFFRNSKAKKIDISSFDATMDTEEDETAEEIALYAIFVVAEQIASIISKCEFKTFNKGQEVRGAEWVNLNYKPNKNQSSTEFWKEVVFKLLVNQEVLIVPYNDQRIIADAFCKDDKAIAESVFTSVSRGSFNFAKTYYSSEVFYLKYSNVNLTALLRSINTKYASLFSEAYEKYIRSGGQKGVLDIPTLAASDPKFEERFDALKNKQMRPFFQSKNAVLPLFGGIKYTDLSSEGAKKSSSEITDIRGIIDEAITRAAQTYKYPPQLVRGEVSGINDAIGYALTVCIDPLLNVISEELTAKEFSEREIIDGSYIEADASCIKHIDLMDIAASADKLISSGICCVDEIRPRIGLTPLNTEESRRFYITKNYERVEKAEETKEEGGNEGDEEEQWNV
ncbi:MAG: phage portal protein [Clostridiales bacterium]|nr:phage portal protein [Clostridiales bacterium]